MNEESNILGTARERSPSAESDFQERIYEVHSGVDSVKVSNRVRKTHVTCFE